MSSSKMNSSKMNNSETVKHDNASIEVELDDRLEEKELSIEDIRLVTGGVEFC